MNWNTVQAAARLKVSDNMVRSMIKRGELTDLAKTKDGGKRHYAKLDSKDVIAFARTHKLVGRKFIPISETSVAVQTSVEERQVRKSMAAPVEPQAPPILQRIEEKLDRIIKMWS